MIHLDFKYENLGGTPALRGSTKALLEFARDADHKPPYVGALSAYDCMSHAGEHSHVIVAIEEEASEEWEEYIVSLALDSSLFASHKLVSVSSFQPSMSSPPWES